MFCNGNTLLRFCKQAYVETRVYTLFFLGAHFYLFLKSTTLHNVYIVHYVQYIGPKAKTIFCFDLNLNRIRNLQVCYFFGLDIIWKKLARKAPLRSTYLLRYTFVIRFDSIWTHEITKRVVKKSDSQFVTLFVYQK